MSPNTINLAKEIFIERVSSITAPTKQEATEEAAKHARAATLFARVFTETVKNESAEAPPAKKKAKGSEETS